jgi:DNA-directed RNA polymerase specialized sigma24 family protein
MSPRVLRGDAAVREQPVPDAAESVVRRAELFAALLRLRVRQRAAVVLRYLDGLSERETAAVLGCSECTVKSHAHRGMAALRRYLDREETRTWTSRSSRRLLTNSASWPASSRPGSTSML